jgi:hypothetical protein
MLAETEDKIKETCFVVRFYRFHHTHSIQFSFLPLARLCNLLSHVGVTSNRINSGDLLMPHPYMYLCFDQLMQSRKVFERWKTFEDVTSLGVCCSHGKANVSRILLSSAFPHFFQGGAHVMTMATRKSAGPYLILLRRNCNLKP